MSVYQEAGLPAAGEPTFPAGVHVRRPARPRQLSLRVALLTLLVGLLVATVGSIGLVQWVTSVRAIRELENKSFQMLVLTLSSQVQNFLEPGMLALQEAQTLAAYGRLSVDDTDALAVYLVDRLRYQRTLSWLSYSDAATGRFVGAWRGRRPAGGGGRPGGRLAHGVHASAAGRLRSPRDRLVRAGGRGGRRELDGAIRVQRGAAGRDRRAGASRPRDASVAGRVHRRHLSRRPVALPGDRAGGVRGQGDRAVASRRGRRALVPAGRVARGGTARRGAGGDAGQSGRHAVRPAAQLYVRLR